MARSKSKGRGRPSTYGPARSNPLDHTAGRYSSTPSLSDIPSVSLAEIREAFSIDPVRPLIRTVLDFPAPPPRRGKRQSPTLSVRATFRSSNKATRSPFLNATTVTPQLTERAILCAKRSIRREVIFATRSTGKGSKAPRRKRSKVKC